MKPRTDPAFNHRLLWREIAARPSDAAAAWAVLYGIVEEHVERLLELLATNEASEAEADPDWANRGRTTAVRRSSGTGGISQPRRGSCTGHWIRCGECGIRSSERGMKRKSWRRAKA